MPMTIQNLGRTQETDFDRLSWRDADGVSLVFHRSAQIDGSANRRVSQRHQDAGRSRNFMMTKFILRGWMRAAEIITTCRMCRPIDTSRTCG